MTKSPLNLSYKIFRQMSRSEFALFCDRICFIALCAVVVCVPFAIAGVEIFFTTALVAFLLKKTAMRDRTLPLSKTARFIMCAFLVSACISFLRSEYLYLSFRGYIRWWKGFLLLIMVAETLANASRMHIFIKTHIVMLGISSLDGLFQLVVGRDFLRWQEGVYSFYDYMIRGGFGHYNNYSVFLASLIPIGLSFFSSCLRLTKRTRLIESAIIILASVALWHTKSRSGMVALFVNLSVFGLAYRRKLFGIYLTGLVSWAFFFSAFSYISRFQSVEVTHDGVQNYLPKDFALLMERGTGGRFAMWGDALSLAKERPLFGSGPNTFLRRYQTKNRETYAHNSYLQILVELGAIGLLLFLMLLARLYAECFRTLRRPGDNTNHVIRIGLLTAVSSFLMHAFFDHNFYVLVLAALFWSLLGAALSCAKLHEVDYKHQTGGINPKH